MTLTANPGSQYASWPHSVLRCWLSTPLVAPTQEQLSRPGDSMPDRLAALPTASCILKPGQASPECAGLQAVQPFPGVQLGVTLSTPPPSANNLCVCLAPLPLAVVSLSLSLSTLNTTGVGGSAHTHTPPTASQLSGPKCASTGEITATAAKHSRLSTRPSILPKTPCTRPWPNGLGYAEFSACLLQSLLTIILPRPFPLGPRQAPGTVPCWHYSPPSPKSGPTEQHVLSGWKVLQCCKACWLAETAAAAHNEQSQGKTYACARTSLASVQLTHVTCLLSRRMLQPQQW